MRYTVNYNLKKPEGTDIVNIDDLNENADIIDQKLKELEDGVYNVPPNSVNDLAIGTRTPDQTQVPTSPGTGTLTQLFSWLANRIKAITGKTNWWDAPPTTLQAAKTHIDAAAPHSGHETPAGAQAKADTAETNAKNHANGLVGSLSSLLTTAKTNIVAAINEVFNKAEDVEDNLVTHKAEIATSTQLGHVKVGENLVIDSDGTLHAQASGGSSKKVARFVIGTSTAGWTSDDCDYLCDGTNDQEEIIQALNDLPATGGEVVILDGTYNIMASINIPKDNVSLRGNGNATTLKRMYNSTNTDSGATAKGLITLNEKSGCKIQGLQIDGNKAAYNSSYNYGIYLSSSSNNTVTGNTCNNNDTGIRLLSSSNNTVTGNTCNNDYYGIYLRSSSDNMITGNTCCNNSSGIQLSSSSSDNMITGNTCYNNSSGIQLSSLSNDNTITSNTCHNNSNNGIYLHASSNNTITGNTCNNNSNGIQLSTSSNNTITGNTCIRGTGQTSDYTSSQYTIHLLGSSNNYNLVSSNNCMGKAVVISGGTGNSAWGNKFDDTDDLP